MLFLGSLDNPPKRLFSSAKLKTLRLIVLPSRGADSHGYRQMHGMQLPTTNHTAALFSGLEPVTPEAALGTILPLGPPSSWGSPHPAHRSPF